MNVAALKSYVVEKIKRQDNDTLHKIDLFNKMFENHLINRNHLLKACINDYYSKKYKENLKEETNSIQRDTVLDVSIKFEISKTTVENCIYKFSHIRLNF